MSELDEVLGALRAVRFRYRDEYQLQDGVEAALRAAELPAQREVRLTPRDRVDVLVGTVGIECKVAGSTGSVLRQLERYSESPLIESIVVVTDQARHQFPSELNGKAVIVHSLLSAAF